VKLLRTIRFSLSFNSVQCQESSLLFTPAATMGTSQSSHAKYSNNVYSSTTKGLKSVGTRTSVRGRKKSFAKWTEESAPYGLVGSVVSHTQNDDVHHPDFDFSERFSDHMDHHEIDLREVTNNESPRRGDFLSIEEIDDDDDELSDDGYESDEEEFGKRK
jgi:hypothetical protein